MSAYVKLKKRVYEIIGPSAKGDRASGLFDVCLCTLVLLSGAAVIAELIGVPGSVGKWLLIFEYATVGVFILEYLLRLWTCEYEYPECRNKLEAVKEFITSFESLIDIISILSILFNQIPKELAFLRLVKLIKLARLAKMGGYIKTSDRMHARVQKIKTRVWEILEAGREGDKLSRAYDIISVILIVISVSFILVETFPISELTHRIILGFEMGIACLFAVEYILRIWTAPLGHPDLREGKARMMYIFSFMSLIDILSIFPVFVANLPTATGILKVFKLCKIVRLVKVSRYLRGVANFGLAIKAKKKQILLSVVSLCVMIVICSVLMYSFENKEQPDIFENGLSGLSYGLGVIVSGGSEIEPVTAMGKGLSTVMLLLGGCIFGVPVAIIATGFEDMISEQAGAAEEEKAVYELLKSYDGLDADSKRKIKAYINAGNGTDNDDAGADAENNEAEKERG